MRPAATARAGPRAIALAAALYRKMKRIAMQYISEVQDKSVAIARLQIRTTIGYGRHSAAIDPNSWFSPENGLTSVRL
jgi:hypothetical protein